MSPFAQLFLVDEALTQHAELTRLHERYPNELSLAKLPPATSSAHERSVAKTKRALRSAAVLTNHTLALLYIVATTQPSLWTVFTRPELAELTVQCCATFALRLHTVNHACSLMQVFPSTTTKKKFLTFFLFFCG